ncbi:hypothetical protein Q4489_08230 [Thalassotalea sp. 1_MG-2023]|uniref:hypothetical protein n=1 Tax=Thalassotalea sp. 1_MG-2023 TaxID=3062680 RepID=UPI0026E4100C|nr:hypothetical protein [Thalassotalea sp. 1_MG-2023]MDO6426994.1 hypothetical protein [Thalassotalea sp. 1_MG-2023]
MMNCTIKVLIVIQLMLFHLLVNAQNINGLASQSNETWSFSKELRATFVKKQNLNYLVISNSEGRILTEHLIPRAKLLANITWASNDQYLTFTENNRSLWLFNIADNSATLIEQNFQSKEPLNFNAQWSPNGQWMQYLSNNNSRYPAKMYSLKRKRAYLVPVASDVIVDIAWHDNKNELVINTDQSTKEQTEMSLYDIKMTLQPEAQIVQVIPFD